jgi:hypothetical protein
MNEKHTYHNTSYYQWIFEVCGILNIPAGEGAKLVDDLNWFGCYDDGLTPQEAVDEAKANGVV